MHHSDERPETHSDLSDMFRRLEDKADEIADLGATGRFPQGKLDPTDQGEIRMAITVTEGKVCIGFGKSVDWIAMDPGQAVELGELLLTRAREAEKQRLVGPFPRSSR